MPCGGIYPVTDKDKGWCFGCGATLDGSELCSFVEEWDALIHDRCIDSFLTSPDGQLVISHGHDIIRR